MNQKTWQCRLADQGSKPNVMVNSATVRTTQYEMATVKRFPKFCGEHKDPMLKEYGPFAKYQLSDGSPLVSMVSIDKNVKFPLNIRYF
jgi:hypothetical protein